MLVSIALVGGCAYSAEPPITPDRPLVGRLQLRDRVIDLRAGWLDTSEQRLHDQPLRAAHDRDAPDPRMAEVPTR